MYLSTYSLLFNPVYVTENVPGKLRVAASALLVRTV